MQQPPAIPTVEDVERITRMEDSVLRNLQITQCYHELSVSLARQTGPAANWCTFATWASKQAGQTIRKEDLARLLERRLRQSPSAAQASGLVASALPGAAQGKAASLPAAALGGQSFSTAVERASDAVGRGNRKVFEEIGFEFTRFFQTCLVDGNLNEPSVALFCAAFRPGDPPDGQDYLRQAFTHYAQSLKEPDAKARAELILLANIEIGFHEQTRLQPEIAESLDAGLVSFLDFARPLFRMIFPLDGWVHLAHLYLRRLLGRPTPLDLAIQALLSEVRLQFRQIITEAMMTISLPSGVVLRLGRDLTAEFPETLRQITHPELRRLLAQHDLTPDSLAGSGAVDWADLPDRLHFILDLFRCCQEQPSLFEPPFTPDQVEVLKAGRLPPGRL